MPTMTPLYITCPSFDGKVRIDKAEFVTAVMHVTVIVQILHPNPKQRRFKHLRGLGLS